ncbi:MAG: hydantoinase B/oxoprolinase family protein [Phaeodactylibacter sp.]|nr:hydantoinase B/oxoprolinase family protein [Phaeodactylibacter sp.]
MQWQIWIDTGGTFTDCIAISPEGQTQRIKVLSSSCLRGRLLDRTSPASYRISHNWPINEDIFSGYTFRLLGQSQSTVRVLDTGLKNGILRLSEDLPLSQPTGFEISTGEEAPVLAARLATLTPLEGKMPPIRMRLGSTKGTNALLERKGARVALLITKGFGDLLLIGAQQRPNLFQLDIPAQQPLYEYAIEIEERMDALGNIVQPLSAETISSVVEQLKKSKVQAVAIALLHAYRNPVHEKQLGIALKDACIPFISLSHQLSPSIKLLPRTQTALANAYLAPIIETYLGNILATIGAGQQLHVMSSAGGLAGASLFHAKDSLLSGPAGGVVGAATIAQKLGVTQVLTVDMGGTSTDTARYDGQYDYTFTTQVGGVEMSSPCLAIETVAAGGGSICYFDGQRLQVGPESAGADPGPASYGAGGPLAITDVNLLLGKLDPALMGIPINISLARDALRNIRQQVEQATDEPHSEEELLKGFENIANEKMAEAIRRISVAKGFSPADYALLAFGGAGGLHACKIAELLDMDTIILPYDGGLLSAYGIGQAQVERLSEQQVLEPLPVCQPTLSIWMERLAADALGKLAAEGFDTGSLEIRHQWAYLRLQGQDSTLEIPFGNPDLLAATFEEQYTRLFGHYPEGRAIEVESLKVVAATRHPLWKTGEKPAANYQARPQGRMTSTVSGIAFPVFHWDELGPGAEIEGPALLLNPTSTAFLEKGWRLQMHEERNAILHRNKGQKAEGQEWKESVELELFTNRFSAIAEETGAQLQRTAFSVNIKERLDFSCAILDPDGKLLANAPHIPVHLGSLGICARLVLEKLPLGPGDVIITNHPKYGGSHLPDVTLLSGAFTREGQLIGYLINRAHHAEIGGRRPGSMPPDARALAEEGVAIVPTYLAKGGKVDWHGIQKLLTEAAFPTRALPENLADINAALAALKSGEAGLQKLVTVHGLEKVHYYMKQLQATATASLNQALALSFTQNEFAAEEYMDDGRAIKVRITISAGQLHFDFSGAGAPHPHNLNANLAIVHSAVIYVLRLLCKKDIPLNEGLMENVRFTLPESFLNPPFEDDASHCPAVVGGNTEVSQRLVDTLLKAFGLAACSQGTMNNFLFGNARFGYYETIGGGVGAGPGFHGRSAVHQHMTNTRITDPEALEFRYPVRLHRFAIRRGSGGQGRWHGGDGIIREIEFLEPVAMTILSQHRAVQPYGMEGGQSGAVGIQYLIRRDGVREGLEGSDSADVQAGDRLVIETPGGGGWGRAEQGKNIAK